MHLFTFFPLLSAVTVFAATAAEWRGKIVYQVLTDRLGRTDGSTTAACDPAEQIYCGGTWQGIIDKLDYIQNMGFTAVYHLGSLHEINCSNSTPDLDLPR